MDENLEVEEAQETQETQEVQEIIYKKYSHDLPKEYCCGVMQRGVEDIEFIEYDERFDEYCFSSFLGYPFSRMSFCPYCGKEIESLRALFSVQKHHFYTEKGWEPEDVERYWDFYREGKSREEAERIVEQERLSQE